MRKEGVEVTSHFAQRGHGHAVQVYLDNNLDRLMVRFEKKIEPCDGAKGKLVSCTAELIKRRGGKRWTVVGVSYENAEALYCALGRALQDVRERRARRDFEETPSGTCDEVLRAPHDQVS